MTCDSQAPQEERKGARPRILLVAPRVPYPPVGGEFQKNYELIRILNRHFDLVYVAMSDTPLSAEADAFLSTHTVTHSVHVLGRTQRLLSVIGSLFRLEPLQVGYFFSPALKCEVERAASSVDLVYCVLIRTAQYARSLKRPKVLDMADLMSVNHASMARTTPRRWMRLLYRLESWLLSPYERRMVNQFDATLLFNSSEVEQLARFGRVVQVPHGINPALLTDGPDDFRYRGYVVFIGKMDYQPNVDAVVWFAREVMPLLPADLRFVIVGAKPVRAVTELAVSDSRIEVTGFVDSFAEIVRASLCVVAPMQSGSGIQNKVIEAMALGAVNVVSRMAAAPLDGVVAGRELFIEDAPSAMAHRILALHTDPTVAAGMGEAARAFVTHRYSWDGYAARLLEILHPLIYEGQVKAKVQAATLPVGKA